VVELRGQAELDVPVPVIEQTLKYLKTLEPAPGSLCFGALHDQFICYTIHDLGAFHAMPRNTFSSSSRSQTAEGGPKQYIVMAVAGVTLLFSLIVILYYMSGLFGGGSRVLDTPAWKTAVELSTKLAEQPTFHDVGISVESEKPLKFKVTGAVYATGDIDKLKAAIAELHPDGEFTYEVEVLRR
jgi:hypothetical protein